MLRAYGLPRVIYIPNPMTELFEIIENSPTIIRTGPRVPARLLWVGCFDEVTKQISELPLILREMVKYLPEVHLDIVGPDNLHAQADLVQVFAEYGLTSQVTFHGPQSAQELADFYRQSDLFIFTSISEASPSVLWEACAYGLPVVMYELPWLPMAQNNLGCLQVPQRDREAFCQSAVKLFRDSKAYALSSQAMLAKFEQLKQTDITQPLLDLVNNRVSELVFSEAEQAEYGEIMARFIIYNSARNSRVERQRLQHYNIDQGIHFQRQADTIKVLIYSQADTELEKLRYQSQYKLLRALRSKAELIKRAVMGK
jgi:hypothetical protein